MRPITGLIFGLTLCLWGWTVSAFEVSPMRVVMGAGGSQSQTMIRVANTTDAPLPIEVTIKRRIVTTDGEQSFEPEGRNFTIFPPQALIQPGQVQAFRIQYIGPPELANSESYIASVTQLPVQRAGEDGVIVVYSFGVALYVVPSGATEDPVLVEASSTPGKLSITLRNEGTKHAFLTNDRIEISSGQGFVLEGDALSGAVGNPILPPGALRRFEFDLPGLPGGVSSSSVRYTPREN